MQRPTLSPFMALSLLSAFRKGLVQLTQGEYDQAFDTVVEFLEQCNDNKFRLKE